MRDVNQVFSVFLIVLIALSISGQNKDTTKIGLVTVLVIAVWMYISKNSGAMEIFNHRYTYISTPDDIKDSDLPVEELRKKTIRYKQ